MAVPPAGIDLKNNATDQPVPTSNPWPGRTRVFQQAGKLRGRANRSRSARRSGLSAVAVPGVSDEPPAPGLQVGRGLEQDRLARPAGSGWQGCARPPGRARIGTRNTSVGLPSSSCCARPPGRARIGTSGSLLCSHDRHGGWSGEGRARGRLRVSRRSVRLMRLTGRRPWGLNYPAAAGFS